MVLGLVTTEEQERIFAKLLEYYKKLYPGVLFRREEKMLSKNDIAGIYYTYPGEEEQATAAEKMQMISEAIGHGYDTPLIILKKKGKLILLDGHRRVRVAFEQGLGWKALLLSPQKDVSFGMEKMTLGKVRDLFGKKKK